MSKALFNSWLNLVKDINNSLPEMLPLSCPVCNNSSIDFQYVGDVKTRIGYLDIWCTQCLNGIHISRTIIPENINILPFDTPKEEVLQRIPSYKQVIPK